MLANGKSDLNVKNRRIYIHNIYIQYNTFKKITNITQIINNIYKIQSNVTGVVCLLIYNSMRVIIQAKCKGQTQFKGLRKKGGRSTNTETWAWTSELTKSWIEKDLITISGHV